MSTGTHGHPWVCFVVGCCEWCWPTITITIIITITITIIIVIIIIIISIILIISSASSSASTSLEHLRSRKMVLERRSYPTADHFHLGVPKVFWKMRHHVEFCQMK
jgi:hypothetical protein